jgi:hypothetical protein
MLHFHLLPDTELIEDVCDNEKDGQHLVGRVASDESKIGIAVAAEILAQYTGSYELKMPPSEPSIFEVSLSGGHLILSGAKLTPISQTEFSSSFGTVKFRKDDQGTVTHLILGWSSGGEDELARTTTAPFGRGSETM